VKGLENKEIKVHMLYNIFSNFGNILKILFIPSKSSALLEFENAEYSTICMDYLNNIVFMGKPLRVRIISHQIKLILFPDLLFKVFNHQLKK